ncbi:MAG: mCpol domain-containing protein [Coleofasciculaceae cyanobacterium]
MPHKSLVCIGDGDDIGETIEFYLLSNDLENASKFSFKVKYAIENIASCAISEMQASLIYMAGDDICFVVKQEQAILQKLKLYSSIFQKKTGKTISFGIGRTPCEASFCLRKAKVSGKGNIVMVGVEE